jgi:hypothetical protein
MAERSDAQVTPARSQASLRVVAQALSATPLEALAEAIGKDDSTASRVRSEEARVSISDAVRLITAAGLKVVAADKVCVDRARYEAMVTIASAAMADQQTARRLTWDEES